MSNNHTISPSDDTERQYQEGIKRGADAIAREIDQELIQRFIGRGRPEGTPQDFKDAQETFKHIDIAAVCRRLNRPVR